MPKIPELFRRGPSEQEQQRADTKSVFGEITVLAPRQRVDYVSSSLSSLILSSSGRGIVARLLDLNENDPLLVTSAKGSVFLRNNGTGRNRLTIDYHAKTYAVQRIRPNNTPFDTKDQSLLLNLFGIIKDDLITRRLQWKESMEKQRRKFVKRLSHKEASVLSHAMDALSDMLSQKDHSVFGVIEDRDEGNNIDKTDNKTRRIRLFATEPITEEVANGIFREIDDDSVIGSSYVRDLGHSSIDSTRIDTRMLVVRYPDFQVQVENIQPVTDRYTNTILGGSITEKLFKAFLEGREQSFRPLTSTQDLVLLEQYVDYRSFFDTEIDELARAPKNSEVSSRL